MVRARGRELAGLRHAAPPSVHRLAPLLRRHRRMSRSRRRVGAARGRRCSRSRSPSGVGAHALDELRGRPLRTGIPSSVLVGLAAVSIAGACAIGVVGAISVRAVARGTRSRRALPGARLQPRAPRRTLPLGSLVRARVGRLPGRLRLRSGRGRSRPRRAARRCLRRAPLAGAASALESRALRAPPRRHRRGAPGPSRRLGGRARAPSRSIAAEETGLRLLAAASVVLAAALVAFRI